MNLFADMIIKKIFWDNEGSFLIDGIGKMAGMPKKLIKEALGFVNRNKINGKNKPLVCEKCLQAHIMKKAQEMRVKGEIEVTLVKI